MEDRSGGQPSHNTAAPQGIPPYTLLGGPENIKLLFDAQLADQREGMEDKRGWEQLKLRKAQNSETLDNLVHSNAVLAAQMNQLAASLAGQIGVTSGQQTVSPIRTGTGDEIAATPGSAAAAAQTANAQVAANIAQLASALVPIIAATSGVVSAEALAALLPVVIAAVGEASAKAAKSPA